MREKGEGRSEEGGRERKVRGEVRGYTYFLLELSDLILLVLKLSLKAFLVLLHLICHCV